MAAHSSILAWRIPWTEEPDGLQSMGAQKIGHDWATNSFFHFQGSQQGRQNWALLSEPVLSGWSPQSSLSVLPVTPSSYWVTHCTDLRPSPFRPRLLSFWNSKKEVREAPHMVTSIWVLPRPRLWGNTLSLGVGNGTPLQYFCLENPMDGGAW